MMSNDLKYVSLLGFQKHCAGIWIEFLCFPGHFFWARHVRSGDIVDVKFKKNQNIRAVYIVTGFDREEERAGKSKFYLCRM